MSEIKLGIVMDDDTPTLLAVCNGWVFEQFIPGKSTEWEVLPKSWLMPPGYARPVSKERIEQLTGGIKPKPYYIPRKRDE